MATEYTITYTYTGQGNTSGTRSVAFSKFKASGDTGRTIAQITSIQYVHYHTSTNAMTWNLRGRLVFSDGTTITSPNVGNHISGNIVKYTHTFTTLPTAEQFATLSSVQTLDSQGKTTSGGYSAKLYWRANSDYPMKLIVKFIEVPPVVYAPNVDKFELTRCNASGGKDDEGQYIGTTLKLSVGDSSGLSGAQCRVYYAANTYPEVGMSQYIDLTSKISTLVSGVALNTTILTGVWSLGTIWNFAVVFIVGEETAIATASVARGSVNFHISNEPGGGAAVGGFSTGTTANPKFESHVPAYFNAGIPGVTSYSTEEISTGGKWIDGKPIYRYMVVATVTLSGAQGLVGTLPSTPETVVNMRGSLNTISDNSFRPIPFAYHGNNNWNTCVYVNSSNQIFLILGSAYTGSQKAIIVIDYTKK